MHSRSDLHEVLCTALGSRHVYFQPPASVKMEYPAIVYERRDIVNDFADNNVYKQGHSYQVTVIDKNPDSEIVNKISKLPTCKFDRHFASENLNHDVFRIFY